MGGDVLKTYVFFSSAREKEDEDFCLLASELFICWKTNGDVRVRTGSLTHS